MFTDGNVAGGRKSIASTAFGDADNPMWDPKPGCMLLKQGNFIVSKDFLPAEVVADVDKNIGVFGFPPATAGGDNPTLGGGDMATLLSDSKSAKEVMKILAGKDIGKDAAPTSSYLSPHKGFDAALYPSDLTRSDRGRGLQDRPVPLRRFRLDAGCRGSGHVLEGHDRLDHR